MGQVDRNEENIIFKRNKVTGELDLAPVFDFTTFMQITWLLQYGQIASGIFAFSK